MEKIDLFLTLILPNLPKTVIKDQLSPVVTDRFDSRYVDPFISLKLNSNVLSETIHTCPTINYIIESIKFFCIFIKKTRSSAYTLPQPKVESITRALENIAGAISNCVANIGSSITSATNHIIRTIPSVVSQIACSVDHIVDYI